MALRLGLLNYRNNPWRVGVGWRQDGTTIGSARCCSSPAHHCSFTMGIAFFFFLSN